MQQQIKEDDRPLTREDVERLLQEAGNPNQLNLQGKNLRQADLSQLDLHGANMRGADLRDVNLQEANLADVDLTNAQLAGAKLLGAYLKGTQPDAYDLIVRVGTSGVGKTSSIAAFLERQAAQEGTLVYLIDPKNHHAPIVSISILEEPLTVYNVYTIFSALTELSTKYWLIAKRRFADLIEYTQTRNTRFVEGAQAVIIKATYQSPFNISWQIDLSASNVAEALVTTIDGITQVRKRLEKAELENQVQAQAIKEAEQLAEHTGQMAQLEREKTTFRN